MSKAEEAEAARELPAGDEIEDALDRLFFNGMFDKDIRRAPNGSRRNRRYSRDLRAAMDALTVWFAPYLFDSYTLTYVPQQCWHPEEPGYKPAHWSCEIEGCAHEDVGVGGRDCPTPQPSWWCEGEGETLPLAICRAMLQISDDDEDDKEGPWLLVVR